MDFAESSEVSTPPAVTSAFSKPSVLAGVSGQAWSWRSASANESLCQERGGAMASRRSASRRGSAADQASDAACVFRGAFESVSEAVTE